MTTHFELVATPQWAKRFQLLKDSIKVRLADKATNAVQMALDTAAGAAPEFNEGEYDTRMWKWIFENNPNYKPKAGAIKGALVFDSTKDRKYNAVEGYIVGYGNISRLNEATDGFGDFIYIGGPHANQPEKWARNMVRPNPNHGMAYPGGVFQPKSLFDYGFWYAMEYGMQGKKHTVTPRNFMGKGTQIITKFWEMYIKKDALKLIAKDWNGV